MNTKQQIIAALDLAISDHKVFAGHCVDWDFISALNDAKRIVEAAEESALPVALVNELS